MQVIAVSCRDTSTTEAPLEPRATGLQTAVSDAGNRLGHSTAGSGEKQYPQDAIDELNNAMTNANHLLHGDLYNTTQYQIDKATSDLYDACTRFESQVSSSFTGLTDSHATREIRYLCCSPKQIARKTSNLSSIMVGRLVPLAAILYISRVACPGNRRVSVPLSAAARQAVE